MVFWAILPYKHEVAGPNPASPTIVKVNWKSVSYTVSCSLLFVKLRTKMGLQSWVQVGTFGRMWVHFVANSLQIYG
jgi:hypothetical protein